MSKEPTNLNIFFDPIENPHEQDQDTIIHWILDHKQVSLVGYTIRHHHLYAYGLTDKQSILDTKEVRPMGICELLEKAQRRVRALLVLALELGVSVMGKEGIPTVVDLSLEPERDSSNPK